MIRVEVQAAAHRSSCHRWWGGWFAVGGTVTLLVLTACNERQRQDLARKLRGGPVVHRTPTTQVEDPVAAPSSEGDDRFRRVGGDQLERALAAAEAGLGPAKTGNEPSTSSGSASGARRDESVSAQRRKLLFSSDRAGRVPASAIPSDMPIHAPAGSDVRAVRHLPGEDGRDEQWTLDLESSMAPGKLAKHYIRAFRAQGYETSHIDVPSPAGRVIQVLGQRPGAQIEGQFSRKSGDLHTRGAVSWRRRGDPRDELEPRKGAL